MVTTMPWMAFVFIPNCDKIVPGMLMAAARLNLPSIFVSGTNAYRKAERANFDLNSVFEAVGAHAAGNYQRQRTLRCGK